MKYLLILATMLLTFKFGNAQNAVNLSEMRFEKYQTKLPGGGSEVLEFISNTKATLIMHSAYFHTVCPCSYSVAGNKIKMKCICHEDEPKPDVYEYTYTYDKNKRILVDSRYLYTSGSAPTSDLAGKPIIWRQ